ncbi:MAG: AEC family transporter [Anaerolineae bacterium]
MFTVSYALFPIFGLIVLGQLLRKFQFPGDAFWPLAARLTYFVFFPALLTRTVALADLQNLALLPMMAALATSVLALSLIVLAGKPLLPVDNPGFTSLFQGSIRHNTYVGLAAAAALLGSTGLTLSAVALVTLIPLVNLLSVMALTRFGRQGRAGWAHMVRPVVTNPLILACLVGALLNLSGVGLPFITDELLNLLGRAALPIGLLVVGAGLDLALLRTALSPIFIASGFKLMLFPVLTALFCAAFGLAGQVVTTFVIFTALPCAPSAYILAMELGGDSRLMAAILTGQTILAALTMPLMIIWLG